MFWEVLSNDLYYSTQPCSYVQSKVGNTDRPSEWGLRIAESKGQGGRDMWKEKGFDKGQY